MLPDIWELVRPRRWALALGLVLIAINRGAGLVLPASLKFVVDDVILKRHANMLPPIIAAVVGATIIQGLTSYSLSQLLSISAQRMIAELRRKVQAHVGRLPVAYYDANKTGVLVSRIMSDVEGIRSLVGTGLVEFVGGIFTALIAIVVLLRISPLLTGLAVAILACFTLFLQRRFKTIRPLFRTRGKLNAEVTGRLTESLGGVRVVKGYHAEDREAAVFSGGVQLLLDNIIQALTAISLMSLITTVMLGSIGALVMYIGAHQILNHTLTLGGFTTFTAFLAFVAAPVFQAVGVGSQLTEALAGLDRTREVLHVPVEDADPGRTVALPPIRGEVDFEDVTFAYEASKPVLHGISLQARPGSVTALVGPSGSGKSTLTSLIAGFYKPESGRILIDGTDLAGVRLDSYRTQLGVVLQETFLFDGSIRENVAFGRPGATDDEILAACRIARVDEFAETFEKTYDTVIGERGVKLSGGQRQRVSIARAVLADPRILILDEATSSLDSESEAAIQRGLAYLMQGRTTFVIAHRLSTIRRADQILVVEAGRIVERGRHPELMALHGRYWDLYTRQHGVEEDLFLAPGEGGQVEEDERVPEAPNGGAAPLPGSLPRLLREP
jgi:ABC-type multidrug transport system fused ATPase/permease subunit